jgi:hypothetical protein
MGKSGEPVISSDDLAACAVRIVHRDFRSREAAGTAILVDSGHVVTCAHVVEAVLGLGDPEHLTKPQVAGAQVLLELGVIIGRPHQRTGTVINWYAITDEHADNEPSDIAVLKLDTPTDVSPKEVLWSEYQPNDIGSFYGFGKPDLWVECECMGRTTNLVQLNCRQHEALPGYSGGPVFDRERQSLIGMLVASNAEKRVAKMIESRVLVKVLTRSGLRAEISLANAPQRPAFRPPVLNRQELEQHLALTFDTPGLSTELLEMVGYPRVRAPKFDRPIEFWRAVLQDIELGMIDGGTTKLLAAAATIFPYHPVFAQRSGQPGGS